MSNELTIQDNQDVFTQRQLAALAQIGVQGATPADLAVFLHQCQRTGLDPFNRQIYMINRRQKDQNGNYMLKQTIQVGIDGFRTIARRAADRNHELFSEPETLWCGEDGVWHDVWIAPTPPVAAKVTVRRGEGEFTGVALYREYVGTRFDKSTQRYMPNSMWASKPATMIAKCAEALALRKAFPQDLSGLYTADETDMDAVQAEIVEEETAVRKSYGSRARQRNHDEQTEQQPQSCTPEQADAIFTMLRDCGVASNEEAEQVLYRLTGKHGLTPRQVSRQDADNLLVAAPDFVKRKIMQALQEIRKPQQGQVEVVETTTAEQGNTDSKEAE